VSSPGGPIPISPAACTPPLAQRHRPHLFKLALRERLDALTSRLLDVVEITDRARALRGGHAHPRLHSRAAAQPSTFGHYLGALIEMLLRDARRLLQARGSGRSLPNGSRRDHHDGLPARSGARGGTARLPAVLRNSYGCIAAADYTGASTRRSRSWRSASAASRKTWPFWTSFEVGQLRFSDGYVQISSIMPQKRNPVPVEHLRLMASLCAGKCEAVLTALTTPPSPT
jgi:argininosuccinate lyase